MGFGPIEQGAIKSSGGGCHLDDINFSFCPKGPPFHFLAFNLKTIEKYILLVEKETKTLWIRLKTSETNSVPSHPKEVTTIAGGHVPL